jgi:hypothetical protein
VAAAAPVQQQPGALIPEAPAALAQVPYPDASAASNQAVTTTSAQVPDPSYLRAQQAAAAWASNRAMAQQ